MIEERLDKLATYFIHFDIQNRYNIPFIKFIHMVEVGRWQDSMTQDMKYFAHKCKLHDVFKQLREDKEDDEKADALHSFSFIHS